MPLVDLRFGATPVVRAGDGPTTIVNRELVNTVLYGIGSGIAGGNPNNVSLLDPQASVTVDGTDDIYATTVAAGLFAVIDVIPGGAQYVNPVGVALSISALGLAKESTQLTGNTSLSGIGTSVTGVAKDASLTTINTTVTGVSKDATLAAQTGGGTIANEVATAGVPLLHKAAIVVNDGSQTILTTATRTLGPFTLTKISYELFCSFQEVTAGTALKTVTVGLKFTDSVSGQIVDQVTFDIMPALNTSGVSHQVLISGPTRGDQVTITMLNNDTVSVTSMCTMLQTSRIFTHDHKFRSINTPTYVTIATGGNHPSGGVLIDAAPSVAAAGIAQRVMSCYNGQASLSVNIPVGGAASFFIQHTDPLSLNSGIVEQFAMTAPPTRVTQLFNMPRSQCVINLQNNGASLGVLAATAIVQDN